MADQIMGDLCREFGRVDRDDDGRIKGGSLKLHYSNIHVVAVVFYSPPSCPSVSLFVLRLATKEAREDKALKQAVTMLVCMYREFFSSADPTSPSDGVDMFRATALCFLHLYSLSQPYAMLVSEEHKSTIPLTLACIWLAYKVTDSSEKYSLRMRDLVRSHNRWASAVRRVQMRQETVGQVGGVTAVNPPEEEIVEKICIMEGVLLRISKCEFDRDLDLPGRTLKVILTSVLPPGISPEVRSSLVAKCYQLVNSAYLSPKIVTERSGELVAVACTLLSLRLHGVLPVQQSDVVGGMYSTWYEPFLAKPCRAEEVEEVAREVVLAYTLNEKTLEVTSATVTSPPPSPALMSQPTSSGVSEVHKV
ncbi:Phosphatidylglycerophosphatase and protein-tyrosine phosphatase 1 [Perkinsus olseni]|uniref:Phosphatidylglycerophosphatase and protein-tyrosine phosphatase 1 n=1 Tax=Perkinsus olseni TaxID=32597 RepID=A0A7J6QZ31_PEROL|nr:Phosphatidylglycerophosphatase and protein-tyrosine phosphatase 1 [Perkinsus olseni]